MSLSYLTLGLGIVISGGSGILLFRQIAETREKKRSSRQIKESEEKYRLLFSTENDGIILFDQNTLEVVEINQAGLALYGYDETQIKTRKLPDFFANPPALVKDRLDIATLQGESLHLTQNGTPIPVDISTGQFSAAGRDYICLIVRDIRQRRELQKTILTISHEERRRIGYDLHDGLGQELSAASLTTKALENKLRQKGAPEAEELKNLVSQLNKTISTTRSIARGLAPVSLEQNGLQAALKDLFTTLESQSGIHFRFDWPEDFNITDPTAATHIYRIIQEAVNNSIKHSGTKEISVSFETDIPPATILRITDQGRGFQESTGGKPGMGMKTLQYRAALIGGRMEVISQPGAGVSIVCYFKNS